MEEIAALERVLGQSYGKPPHIKDNTSFNRFFQYIKAYGWSKTIFFEAADLMFSGATSGLYLGKIHTALLLKDGYGAPRMDSFARLHEIAHGYTAQKNNLFHDLEPIIIDGVRKGNIQEAITKAFIIKSIDEGIANYLAIAVDKQAIEDGLSPSDTYAFNMERRLVTLEEPDYEECIIESTPLSWQISEAMVERGERMIDKASRSFVDKYETYMTALNSLHTLHKDSYRYGHYFITALCDGSIKDIAKMIDPVIQDPPTTFEQFHKTIGSYFKGREDRINRDSPW